MHKRSGHLISKMRFVSAQLEAYLSNDVWLRNARHANSMASLLSKGLAAVPDIKLVLFCVDFACLFWFVKAIQVPVCWLYVKYMEANKI